MSWVLREAKPVSPRAEHDHAVGQVQPLQDLLGAARHALVLGLGLVRRRDGDHLDLVELVLADHAARVPARRARFRAEARRQRREAIGQIGFGEDAFADEVGKRNFRRWE